ncbi:Hypothetical protein LUCI_1536 [Lucifera butyrica]|uniref:3D domain-containing protein n=1 Tax=Lucifera butyrica TaxID=1351585 RepID=A0A498R155_9FIRM|nr:3D domain-containing protein [Lucifera butyrica]VBB06306.1 Hypothetical protein LUCI_1536 [Lucifera butyrica]
MKKIAMVVLTAVMLGTGYPLTSLAHAASLESTLSELAGQNQTASRIQGLLNWKNNLNSVNRNVIIGAITQAALDKAAQAGLNTAVLSGADGISVNALRRQISQEVINRMEKYQKDSPVISMLLNAALNPQAALNNNSLLGAPQNYKRVLNMQATAYGPGAPDNGKWGNQNYVGGTVHKGIAAVDPRIIPMGTRLWIEGYGEAVADDQGGAIKGNRIDLAFNSRQEANDYGIKNVKVYVLN